MTFTTSHGRLLYTKVDSQTGEETQRMERERGLEHGMVVNNQPDLVSSSNHGDQVTSQSLKSQL